MSIATSAPLPTLLFAAVTAVTLAGCGVSLDIGDADDGVSRTVVEEVPVGEIRRIEIATENGAVDVSGADDLEQIEVVAVFRERSEGDADHEVVVVDDTLVVTGDCDGGWWNGCSVGFSVSVPADVDVRVDTDNGRVDLHELAGSVRVETGNGAIDASGLAGRDVDARTDNGRVVLAFDDSPRDVTARTDNGAITLRLPADDAHYDVDAASDNGRVDVDVVDDPGADRHISVSSDNGSIDIGPISG